MRFSFTEEQRMSASGLRAALARELPDTAVRAAWADDAPRPSPAWRILTEMGIVGLTVPEAHGGLGARELDLVLLLEEHGRAAAPDPLLETTGIGAPLLAEIGGADDLLARVAAGATLAVALGSARLVADADIADTVLVARPDRIVAIAPGALQLARQRSVDGARRLFSFALPDGAGTVLAEGPAARAALADALDRGALGAAAELLGLGRRMIEMTVEYATVRKQFGVPIGSFQAVKHHLASAHVALEMARPCVYRAAYAMDRRAEDRAQLVSLAKEIGRAHV